MSQIVGHAHYSSDKINVSFSQNENKHNGDFLLYSIQFCALLRLHVDTAMTPHAGVELLHLVSQCSHTDTLMWNAKGFLSRIEKLPDSGEGGGGGSKEGKDDHNKSPERNERDENVSVCVHPTINAY